MVGQDLLFDGRLDRIDEYHPEKVKVSDDVLSDSVTFNYAKISGVGKDSLSISDS